MFLETLKHFNLLGKELSIVSELLTFEVIELSLYEVKLSQCLKSLILGMSLFFLHGFGVQVISQ
jgi:hypothetical protein